MELWSVVCYKDAIPNGIVDLRCGTYKDIVPMELQRFHSYGIVLCYKDAIPNGIVDLCCGTYKDIVPMELQRLHPYGIVMCVIKMAFLRDCDMSIYIVAP